MWGLLSFAAKPLEAKPNDALPVDIISDKQFSEITKGVKDGAKDKTLAFARREGRHREAGRRFTRQGHGKEGARRRQGRAAATRGAAAPGAQRDQARQERAAEDRSDRRDLEEGRGEEESRRQGQGEGGAAGTGQAAAAFDPNKIAALLDKREPTRQASAADTLSTAPSLGKSDAKAAQLSQGEIDAFRKRLGECWNVPPGATDGGQIKVVMRVLLKPDATVSMPPQLVMASASPFGPAMAESAKRAIVTCQPFTMLRPEHYQQWQDMEITFDPREMFGG